MASPLRGRTCASYSSGHRKLEAGGDERRRARRDDDLVRARGVEVEAARARRLAPDGREPLVVLQVADPDPYGSRSMRAPVSGHEPLEADSPARRVGQDVLAEIALGRLGDRRRDRPSRSPGGARRTARTARGRYSLWMSWKSLFSMLSTPKTMLAFTCAFALSISSSRTPPLRRSRSSACSMSSAFLRFFESTEKKLQIAPDLLPEAHVRIDGIHEPRLLPEALEEARGRPAAEDVRDDDERVPVGVGGRDRPRARCTRATAPIRRASASEPGSRSRRARAPSRGRARAGSGTSPRRSRRPYRAADCRRSRAACRRRCTSSGETRRDRRACSGRCP